MTTETINLKSRWDELRRAKPKLLPYDAAEALGVSEVELVATRCGGTAIRLEGNWTDLLQKFPHLEEVRCITRNEAAVHNRFGTFTPPILFNQMAQVVAGPEIDLRLSMSHWKYGFAVKEADQEKFGQSFQFFDQDGTAVHKVFLTQQSSISVYEELVQAFRSSNQSDVQEIIPLTKRALDSLDTEIDVKNFRESWLATGDTHEFSSLLRKFGVSRQQAFRLAPNGYTRQVQPSAARKILEYAASQLLPIMIFVGSAGCTQIHTGPVKNIKESAEWLSIFDDRFIFHLKQSLIASAWVVKKITKEGPVTSLEIFDLAGKNLALFFGKRKPGEVEDPAWQDALATV